MAYVIFLVVFFSFHWSLQPIRQPWTHLSLPRYQYSRSLDLWTTLLNSLLPTMMWATFIFNIILRHLYMQAFQLVDKGPFHCLLQYLWPSLSDWDIPHCTKTQDEILKRATLAVERMKEKLKLVDSRISMTFDLWTSLPGHPFLSLSVHYIDSPADKPWEGELKTKQLAFTPIHSNHSNANIGQILIENIDKYEICTKLRCFMADNATNNDAAIKTVTDSIDLSGEKWNPIEHCVQ